MDKEVSHTGLYSQTPAYERVTLYSTWRPSALTTRPQWQVQPGADCLAKKKLTHSTKAQ